MSAPSSPYLILDRLPPTWLVLVPLGLLSLLFLVVKLASNRETYDFPHVELNRKPGSSTKPTTDWCNMGLWTDTSDFPTACEALALEVMQQANLKAEGSVLDVAHGCGDSLVLLRTHPLLPRQSRITGITSLDLHARRAAVKSSQCYPRLGEEVFLHLGDAVFRGEESSSFKTHPLDPSALKYDSIVCVDAAYHFRTRETFLYQAFTSLEPGGTIALADQLSGSQYPVDSPSTFTFTPSPSPPAASTSISRIILSRILPLLSAPQANIVPVPTLASTLLRLGFEDVCIRDVSHDVYPGFAHFLKGRGTGWSLMGRLAEWWYGKGLLRFCIVSARKPSKTLP